MRIALVQVINMCWIHMGLWPTGFVVRCSCFGYWGQLRCSLPQWPRCRASFGWTSCQPHQGPNCTCWSQVMNMSDGGSLEFSALMCLLWCQWVWARCPCYKSEQGQDVQHWPMVWLDVIRHSTLILCSQTWHISRGSLLPSCASRAGFLAKAAMQASLVCVEYASLQAMMYATYCYRCDETWLSCSFV